MRQATGIIAMIVVAILVLTAASHAQQRWWRSQPRLATPEDFDGAFQYCRVAYRTNRTGIGGGWATDYPDADANLSIRLSELTKIRVSRHPSGSRITSSCGSPMTNCSNARS